MATVVELCQKNEVTIRQLTERCGVEQERVLAIVMGRWTPSPQERRKIADAFGVGVDEVSWGHKTPIQHIYGHGPG
jgi:transcriptional regulator with XRE-family HTH domain